jgi:hypothetical protein
MEKARRPSNINVFFLVSLAPQPSLGLFHKIRLNFLEASQHFLFYRIGLLVPRPTPIPGDQASVFISSRGRVATHFIRLLRHAWVMAGLFLFPCHHMEKYKCIGLYNVLVRKSYVKRQAGGPRRKWRITHVTKIASWFVNSHLFQLYR